jgi:16S rRNA (cytosine967-C5)-methyltransferase
VSRPPSRIQRGKSGSRPADRASAAVSPARVAAFEVLTRVGARKGHSDDLLHSHLTAHLSPEDRNLATALVMGALRWQIALDAQIAPLLSRPDQKPPEAVAVALRLGAFQLLHMDRIPAHAALNESVELCRLGGQPQAAGMVNAVLRKLSTLAKPSAKVYETHAAMARRLAHPQWLIDRWIATYGRDAALAICEYDQHEPPERALFIADSSQPGSGPLPQIDDGSRLVAEIAAAALPHGSPEARIWDCCAAPGGKTLVLAARAPSADILATDISSRRLTQMQCRLQSYSYAERVRTEVLDASSEVAESSPLFDLILCDVPCSGTGTLARNPEIRLRVSPDELPVQSARQREILQHALQRLAPGGRLVYSTCSLEPEENEQVLQTVLAETGCEQLPIEPLLLQLANSGLLSAESADLLLRTAVRNGALRSLPGVHPFDGFYVVILERNKAS